MVYQKSKILTSPNFKMAIIERTVSHDNPVKQFIPFGKKYDTLFHDRQLNFIECKTSDYLRFFNSICIVNQ